MTIDDPLTREIPLWQVIANIEATAVDARLTAMWRSPDSPKCEACGWPILSENERVYDDGRFVRVDNSTHPERGTAATTDCEVAERLRRAHDRLKRVTEGNVGFPECVEAERDFVLTAFDTVPWLLGRPTAAQGHGAGARGRHPNADGPLVRIAPDARKGKEPCGECHIQPGETCDIRGAREAAPAPALQSGDLRAVLAEVVECFDAAYAEGLTEALAECRDDHDGGGARLVDLVERRLLFAHAAALAAPSEPAEVAGLRRAREIIASNIESYGANNKYLSPRNEGNTMGMSYADGIDAEIARLTAKDASS